MLGFAGQEYLFLGRDPFDIERHVRMLDNLQFHYGRMWPLEVALWDLMGKITGQPLWKLLGGRSQRVRVYASTGERLPPSAESARQLRARLPGAQVALPCRRPARRHRRGAGVRAAIGPDMHILVDANQGWHMPWDASPPWDFKTARVGGRCAGRAGRLLAGRAAAPPRLPRPGRRCASARALRIAGGEGNREFAELREYLRHGSLDVYQPDVVWSTGILRARQIAGEVQAAGAIYSPHTWGDGLVLLANLHVSAAVSTAPFIEFPFDPPAWTPERRDFILAAPTLPDEDAVITCPTRPAWA